MTERFEPRTEYRRRLAARREAATSGTRSDARLANARLLVFLIGLALCWAALYAHRVPPATLLVPAVAFAILIVAHARVLQRKGRAEAAVRFYEQGLARLEGEWVGKGVRGEEFAPAEHLYANDLDIFGEGSLFELLCTARTRTGEATLAAWLCEPAPPEEIGRRQAAVEELRNNLDLREDLALYGADVRAAVRPRALAAWVDAPEVLERGPLRASAYTLAGMTLACLALAIVTGIAAPFLLMLVVELVYSSWTKKRVMQVDAAVQEPGRELNVLAQVLDRLEREPFRTPLLKDLQENLREGEAPASRRIAQLDRLVDLMEARHNFLFGPVAFILVWGAQMAVSIEGWRARWGQHVPRWLRALGQLESLSALASYAYEHPDDPFPELTGEGSLFDGVDLGHPLLPDEVCVRNDVRLDSERRLLVVSGSNMSGKSTLLRTVGVNAVLAQAGGPIRGRSLRLSPLTVGATLHVQDSIRKGRSRFYAEIVRLSQMLESGRGPRPVLFLLDEILHGTNSHDRRVGADAVVRAFVEAGGIGLITTHDLAVTHIVDALDGKAANVHFSDHIENGQLVFDYKLHTGVVPEGNALRLMRTLGLPV